MALPVAPLELDIWTGLLCILVLDRPPFRDRKAK